MFDSFFKKFGVAALVAFSLLALLAFVLLQVLLTAGGTDNTHLSDRYFFNEGADNSDEFISKIPNLRDMLAGPIVSWSDPNSGGQEAKVVIVQFADFACGFCYEQEKVMKQVAAKYPEDVRFIWKDYPEPDVQSGSFQAAIAARCAQTQDKFWSYHDLLYESNEDLREETFVSIAGDLDLDMQEFNACREDNEEVTEKILDNMLEAEALGIVGVPFIYVNQQEVMGSISFDDLERIVLTELSR